MKISSIKCSIQRLSNYKITLHNYERMKRHRYDNYYDKISISMVNEGRDDNLHRNSKIMAYFTSNGILPAANVSLSRFVNWYGKYIKEIYSKSLSKYIAEKRP